MTTERGWQLVAARTARGELPITATKADRRHFAQLKQAAQKEQNTQTRHHIWREAVKHVRNLWRRHDGVCVPKAKP